MKTPLTPDEEIRIGRMLANLREAQQRYDKGDISRDDYDRLKKDANDRIDEICKEAEARKKLLPCEPEVEAKSHIRTKDIEGDCRYCGVRGHQEIVICDSYQWSEKRCKICKKEYGYDQSSN
jgi:biotin synthase-like enzyme